MRKYSPADQVKLPVGAYLVEVGYATLDPSITLKGAVKLLRQASKLREDKSMPLGVILTHSANPPGTFCSHKTTLTALVYLTPTLRTDESTPTPFIDLITSYVE